MSDVTVGFGFSLWGKLGPFMLQPYYIIKPFAILSAREYIIKPLSTHEEKESGSTLYMAYGIGLELQIQMDDKIHLLFCFGYAGSFKNDFELSTNPPGIIYESAETIHVYMKNCVYNVISVGFLIGQGSE